MTYRRRHCRHRPPVCISRQLRACSPCRPLRHLNAGLGRCAPLRSAALRCTALHGAVLVAALLQIPARSLRPMLRSTAHDSHGSGAGTTNSSAQGGAHTSSASHQPPPSFELDEPSHLGAAHSRRPIVRADGHARHLPAPMPPPPTTWMAMLLPMDYEPRVQVAYRDYRRAPLYLLSVRLRTLRSTMIVPWVHTASTTSRAAVAAVLRRGVAVASSGLLWTARTTAPQCPLTHSLGCSRRRRRSSIPLLPPRRQSELASPS